jgi:hypothetical protein
MPRWAPRSIGWDLAAHIPSALRYPRVMPRPFRSRLVFWTALALAAVPSSAAAATFNPAADAYVDASLPSSNFGRSSALRTDASPVVTTYLRFSVAGVGSTSSAQLRIFAETANSKGFDVRPVADSSWAETTITAQNAPPAGAVIGSSGPLTAGLWYTIDVSSIVHGDGT